MIERPRTREEANALVKELQAEFDLIDDAELLTALMAQQEARHDGDFESFFKLMLIRLLIGNPVDELVMPTDFLLSDVPNVDLLETVADPGRLVYRLARKREDAA